MNLQQALDKYFSCLARNTCDGMDDCPLTEVAMGCQGVEDDYCDLLDMIVGRFPVGDKE